MTKQTRNTLLLIGCSFIWGMAFIAQSTGAGVGPCTFLACRSWLAVGFLLVLTVFFDGLHRRRGQGYGWPKTKQDQHNLYFGGICCGSMLFLASAAQQIGITLNPSTAKAGFLTAMYVVMVPLIGILFHRKAGRQIWLCVALTVLGLYLLCMTGGFGRLDTSDWYLIACALLFSGQILLVDKYSPLADSVRLSFMQFLTTAVWSTAAAFLFEQPSWALICRNGLPILYCGILSSGVAYTLQIIGQKDLNPTIASLAMCLESVFSALGGWWLLHQVLTGREILGCGLIFTAVVLAQLPLEQWLLRRKSA